MKKLYFVSTEDTAALRENKLQIVLTDKFLSMDFEGNHKKLATTYKLFVKAFEQATADGVIPAAIAKKAEEMINPYPNGKLAETRDKDGNLIFTQDGDRIFFGAGQEPDGTLDAVFDFDDDRAEGFYIWFNLNLENYADSIAAIEAAIRAQEPPEGVSTAAPIPSIPPAEIASDAGKKITPAIATDDASSNTVQNTQGDSIMPQTIIQEQPKKISRNETKTIEVEVIPQPSIDAAQEFDMQQFDEPAKKNSGDVVDSSDINKSPLKPSHTVQRHGKISHKIISAIKQIEPHVFALRGILHEAPNGTKKKKKYICPWCGSGSHDNQTSALEFTSTQHVVQWFCHSCMNKGEGKDNIHLLAKHYGLDVTSDFQEICRRACQEFSISFETDDDYNSSPSTKKPTSTPKKIPADRLNKITAVISSAQENLRGFIDEQGGSWRGLTFDTLYHFHCGYLPDWNHSKKFSKTPRVIIPASIEAEKANYLARLTIPQESLDDNTRRFSSAKEHDGEKTLFNPDALSAKLIVVVEGYIDAMSIWQASNGEIAVVALGGANQGAALIDDVDSRHITGKHFIILFDADHRDNDMPKNLQDELIKRGNFAVCKFIFDALTESEQEKFGVKVDPNQILVDHGRDFLIQLVEKIFAECRADFSALEKKIADEVFLSEQLASFVDVRGDIDPLILPKIKAAYNFIDNLSADNFNPILAQDISVWSKVALCKFYLPTTAKKFFDILKAAQHPTIDIKKEIDSLVSGLKREHKNFLSRQQDEKNKAAHLAVKKKIATGTQAAISDCPVDLFLPDSIYFDSHGVGTQTFSEKVGGYIKHSAALTPIIPTKILREPSKHITQYEIAIKARGIWRSVVVDGDELADARKILRLATYGAIIEHASELTHYFAKILAANEKRLAEIKFFQQPGWHGDKFIYPTGGEDYIVRRAGFNYESEFATVGDADKWRKTFVDACDRGGATARVFLGNALASALIRPFNIANAQIQINGKSGSGKTALEKLAASIFGNPRKLIRTFGATLKNRQAVAAAYNDLPTFLDELETVNGGKKGEDSLPQMIYDFSLGTANQANKRNGDARETFEFYGTRLMTGERPILKSRDQRGAYKRLVQIHVDELFDDYFATAIHFNSENNYGHFGKIWIDFITEHLPEIRDKYAEFNRLFAELPNKKIFEPTLLKSVVVASLAFQYFLVCIGEKIFFDDVQFFYDINAIVAALPTPDELDDSTRALKELQSFVAGHERFFISEADRPAFDNEIPQGTFECYGKIFKNGEVAFLPTALKKILETELGFASMDALIAEWASKDKLRCGKGKNNGRRISTWFNGKNNATYRFKAGVIIDIKKDKVQDDSSAFKPN